jgi:hypothetical protein
MDAHLKLLADASLEVGAAEEAIAEGAHQTARDRLDAAAEVLAALREQWPEMGAAERALVGPAAGDVRGRLDAATAQLPRRSALVEVPAEPDPEQETEPEAA